jgi:hypothetical protein
MARKKRSVGQKGSFTELELPVSREYLKPAPRGRMLVWGGLVALALVGFLLFDLWAGKGEFVSNGPLSSNHAGLEDDCGSCHFGPDRTVSDEKCATCHEKFGDELGVYTHDAHYVYRSDDFRRLVPSPEERPCFACHTEHEGRNAEITRISDSHCTNCHEFGSFGKAHPEFDFAAESIPDSGALRFTHVHHVREVRKREELEDVEVACLYCHNAQPDGKGFEPISFDRHCDACHLTSTIATPALAVAEDDLPGVETLDAIVERGGPGSRWALFSNPGDFRQLGSSVVKTTVYHRDPWILENLRLLRSLLYPDAGLADLLIASPDAAPGDVRRLYEEALATLEAQAIELRGLDQPELQADLRKIEEVLEALRLELEDPYAVLDDTRFQLAFERRNESLSEAERAEIETLVADLTQPCRQCHLVENATITRVQASQRTLIRAEFDHRAHIVQRRCLDCHTVIPIADFVDSTEKVGPELDRAEIRNLPTIGTCQECHRESQSSQRCITCHYFHPNKSRRSELLLYLR